MREKVLSMAIFFSFTILVFYCSRETSVHVAPSNASSDFAKNSPAAEYSSVGTEEVEIRFDSYFDDIEKQLAEIKTGVYSAMNTNKKENTSSTQQSVSMDYVLDSINTLESHLYNYGELSLELKKVYEQMCIMNGLNMEYAQRLDAMSNKVLEMENTVNALILLQEATINTNNSSLTTISKSLEQLQSDFVALENQSSSIEAISQNIANLQSDFADLQNQNSNLEAISVHLTKLQSDLAVLGSQNLNLEEIFKAYIEKDADDKSNTDVPSSDPSASNPEQDPQVEDNQEKPSEDIEPESTEVNFITIDGLSEEPILLSASAGQKYYYKILLFAESFEFDLAETAGEPTVEFFQDEEFTLPIELVGGCLTEEYDGLLYFVITSDCDDEIVFYLRGI